MIGILPTKLEICGAFYEIRSDFRIALTIFQAYNDSELSDIEKAQVCLECLFVNIPVNTEAALKQAVWFLDGGGIFDECESQRKKVIDWEQDEQLIFSGINKIAGCETRSKEYLHWWTFLGFFNEIGEGLLTTVIGIRQKLNKGKTLEKYEQEFYLEHKKLIDLKRKYSKEEQTEIDRINKLLEEGV